MNVLINGDVTEVADGSTVYDITRIIGISETGSAIAINNKLVRRDDWLRTYLAENDDVVIIKAAYGG